MKWEAVTSLPKWSNRDQIYTPTETTSKTQTKHAEMTIFKTLDISSKGQWSLRNKKQREPNSCPFLLYSESFHASMHRDGRTQDRTCGLWVEQKGVRSPGRLRQVEFAGQSIWEERSAQREFWRSAEGSPSGIQQSIGKHICVWGKYP